MTPSDAAPKLNVVQLMEVVSVPALKVTMVTVKFVKLYIQTARMSTMQVIHKMACIRSCHLNGLVHHSMFTAKWITEAVGRYVTNEFLWISNNSLRKVTKYISEDAFKK